MKILDEKGELFGKVNVILFLVILFLLGFSYVFYYVYGIATLSSPPPTTTTYKKLIISLRVKNVEPYLAKVIKKGDFEESINDFKIATIENILKAESSQVIKIDKGVAKEFKHPTNKDIVLEMIIFCEEKEGIFYFKGSPVKIDQKIIFSTKDYSVSGNIMNVLESDIQK
jgi:hypothetical protein